ncbi:MAG TPA: beta-propeller fold lactonase family protein [Terriglobales bacterium]|nr:beta-propeller fold lactonase family protein [Terriglobales bacterium]
MNFSQINRQVFCLAVVVLILLSGVAVFAQSNFVYLETNNGLTGQNAVLGYSNDGNGNLTLLPGAPYPTGGTGLTNFPNTGLALDADVEVVTNPAHTLMFAVDMHSNTIGAFTINANGSLTAVPGSPFPSLGPQPSSLSWTDTSNGAGVLTVMNKDSDPNQTATNPNITTFASSSSGVLTPTGNTITLPSGASPTSVVNGKSHIIFADLFMGVPSAINSYRVNSSGVLTRLSGKTVPNGDHVFFGIAPHPSRNIFYAGLPGDSLIGVYAYAPLTGIMTFTRTVANTGTAICWLTTNKAGTFLYTSETLSNSITVYSLANPTTPTQVQHFTLASGGNNGPTNLAFDTTGKFLYVLTGNTLHVLTVAANGTVKETITPVALPVASNDIAQGLVTF